MIPIRAVLTVATFWILVLGVNAAEEATNTTFEKSTNSQDMTVNVTAAAMRFVESYVVPTVCNYSPEFCARHHLQSRGIQSYLATAGTMLAGVMGIILMKMKILVILTLMSTIIGKMLLFYAFLKSDHYHHHSHKPHHSVPYVKYTKDKYYIKHSPHLSSHDAVVEDIGHSPYSSPQSSGVSYY
ncbi:uncharacterized protein LOC126894567 [Daktulosphaira vitifoliae]|uniref:uncharacterized protein LOC126894567 n=1 Tax=Daktulosphaira vitifoliae TaxID=58002 RepID=UPI0021A9C899|nr:uncharacterized protein LOC126894567 [Daktulosphaira vitifoliae]